MSLGLLDCWHLGAVGRHCWRCTGRRVSRREPIADLSAIGCRNSLCMFSIPYHTACRLRSFRLTPQLVPPSFDIVHSVEDDDAVPLEHTLGSRVGDATRLLLGAGMVVDNPGMGRIV